MCALVLAWAACGPLGEPEAEGEPSAERLTSHPAEDRSPAWSPDGEVLLFASERDGNREIYSLEAGASGPRRMTDNSGLDDSPAWAPDGDRFVFQSARSGGAGLWVASWPEGEPELLVEDESPELVPDWSPDGRWVAFMSRRDGNAELYRVEVASGRLERLTDDPHRDVWPRYEADGESLVFFSRRGTAGEHDDLYRLELADLSVTRLTEHPDHHDFVPDPSPVDGRIVAGFSDRAAGRRELVLYGSGGEVLARFAKGYHRVFHPVWSPDGTSIVYAARVAEGEAADLYRIRAPQAAD